LHTKIPIFDGLSRDAWDKRKIGDTRLKESKMKKVHHLNWKAANDYSGKLRSPRSAALSWFLIFVASPLCRCTLSSLIFRSPRLVWSLRLFLAISYYLLLPSLFLLRPSLLSPPFIMSRLFHSNSRRRGCHRQPVSAVRPRPRAVPLPVIKRQ
jgi:hypothetical protein